MSFVEIGVLAAAVAVAATALPRCSGGAKRARRARELGDSTPGVLNPDGDAGDDRRDDLQARLDAHGASARLATRTRSRHGSCAQYGLRGPPSAFQEDHLISLELGGNPTDPRNLWPEPYPRAAAVDQIENELNARVCAGSLTLAEAQRRESALKHASG